MNPYVDYVNVIADKNILSSFARSVGCKMPKTIQSCQKGFVSGEQVRGKAFIKPSVDTNSGYGCRIIDIDNNGKDIITNESFDFIISRYGGDYVIQEVVSCHKSISKIYSQGVNTFRIITYRWKDKIKHIPSVMRIGRGGNYLDNAHMGGVFLGIKDDGTLCPTAFTEFKESFEKHPDTNVVFDGYKIGLFPLVLEAAHKMHAIIPQIGLINWDFTIDAEGHPLLIEANTAGGSIWLTQMAHGTAAFGEDTAEILQWMRKMKKLKKTRRKIYYYGK